MTPYEKSDFQNNAIYIEHKLYQTSKTPQCVKCSQEPLVTSLTGYITRDEDDYEKAILWVRCNECNCGLLINFERIKPKWVQLTIDDANYKAESIQTCHSCRYEFLISWTKRDIQYDKFDNEALDVPTSCPNCWQEYWINLYEISEFT